MPYKTVWVNPAVALRVRVSNSLQPIVVYHAYADDDFEDNSLTKYRFLWDRNGSFVDSFDVRDLPGWVDCPHPPFCTGDGNTPENRAAWDVWHKNQVELKYIRAFLRREILIGRLRPPKEKANDKA
jgi:hypothetical protein